MISWIRDLYEKEIRRIELINVTCLFIREICDKKNHRSKIMLAMVTKTYYNEGLTEDAKD